MPRYSYRCISCDIVLEKTHSYRDTLTDCEKCETSGSLKKIMSPIKINKKKQKELHSVVVVMQHLYGHQEVTILHLPKHIKMNFLLDLLKRMVLVKELLQLDI